MAVPVKADIVYYRTKPDFELEFNLNGCCNMRLLSSKPKNRQEFLRAIRLAVSRSQVILTLGKLDGEDSLLDEICNAIGYNTEPRDLSVFGLKAEVALPQGSIPLVSQDGRFAGCVIECGPQSIIALTDDRELRKGVMQSLVHQYVRDFAGHRKTSHTAPAHTPHPISQTSSADTETQIEYDTAYVIKEKPPAAESKPKATSVPVAAEPTKKKSRWFTRLLFVLLFIAAGIAAYVFLAEPYIISNMYDGYAELYGQSGDYYEPPVLDTFGELVDRNSDTVGFISVDGTDIAYPVVTDANREAGYYKNRLFNRLPCRYGTPYISQPLSSDTYAKNIIIYGNSKPGELMFSQLEKITTLAGYRTSPAVRFDTIYAEGYYKIFSAFTVSADAGNALKVTEFEDDEHFASYIDSVLSRSFIATSVDVCPTDDIITLAARGGDKETFVFARRLRNGESELIDTQSARDNDLSSGISPLPQNDISSIPVKFTPVVKAALFSDDAEQTNAPKPYSDDEGASSQTESQTDSSSQSSQTAGEASSGEAAPGGEEILTVINAQNGSRVSGTAADIISRMVEAEMGSGFEPEALKAQAVACYSYIKYNQSVGAAAPEVALKIPSEATKQAVNAVLGKRVYYRDLPAMTYYFKCSAGYTADCATVWGVDIPYLKPAESSADRNSDDYLKRITYPAESVRAWVQETTGIDLAQTADKSQWFNVSYDSAGVWALCVRFAGDSENYCARFLRDTVFAKERVGDGGLLPSTAFSIVYRPSTDSFVFECRGAGHGVGMSQYGANKLAQNGSTYEEILRHYYNDIVIK